MRHFLCSAGAPGVLPRRVRTRPAACALIARSGPAARLTAPIPRAPTRAIEIAAVTALTDPHLLPATLAVVEPVARLATCRQTLPPQALDSEGASEA